MKKIFLTLLISAFFIATMAQQRVVLVEQVTNASCSVCATYNPQLFNYTDQNEDKVVVISYHAPFPYQHDSLHFINPGDANARIKFYGANGTPTTIIDGNYFMGSTASLLPTLSSKINTRQSIAPKYTIEIKNVRFEKGEINGDIICTSVGDNSSASLAAYSVLVEKNVYRSSYKASPGSNSENHYKNVMRYLFPSTDGENIFDKAAGDKYISDFSFIPKNVKSLNELRVVVFVQNDTTKEIYQVAYKDLNSSVGIEKIASTAANWAYNSTDDLYQLTLNESVENALIIITDITGRQILQQSFSGNTSTVDVKTLTSGIYLATVVANNTQYTTKLWVE